jgi:2-oxoisovalerate dehydrogenase E1 component
MLRTAIASPDPCILFEARGLYQTTGPVRLSEEVEEPGKSVLRRPGTDAVVITWGTMVRAALEASQSLEEEGIHVGVLDLRWLCPLDEKGLVEAVRNAHGRAIVLHEANKTGGFGAEIVARLHEAAGEAGNRDSGGFTEGLRAIRIASPDIRMPATPSLQAEILPSAKRVVDAVKHLLER